MHENDSIDGMVTKFAKITNSLASVGDAIDNDKKVRSFMLYHNHRRSKLQL